LAPEYEKAATNLKGIIRVGGVNCDEEKELCGYFGIKGFPTIKLFPAEGSVNKGQPTKTPMDYNNQRTAAPIVNFALGYLPSYVATLTPTTIKKFLSDSSKAKVLLFTEKDKTPNLYKALSVDFVNRLQFGEVRKTHTQLVKEFSVETFPTIMVIKVDGEQVVYGGKMDHSSLMQFLTPFALPSTSSQKSPPPEQQQKKEEEAAVLYEIVDQATLDKACLSKAGSCLLIFYDRTNLQVETPLDEDVEADKRYTAVVQQLFEKYKKSFNFGWIDVATSQQNAQFANAFDLRSFFPTVVVLNPKKQAYIPFVGAFELNPLSDFLDKVLVGRKVPVVLDNLPTLQPIL